MKHLNEYLQESILDSDFEKKANEVAKVKVGDRKHTINMGASNSGYTVINIANYFHYRDVMKDGSKLKPSGIKLVADKQWAEPFLRVLKEQPLFGWRENYMIWLKSHLRNNCSIEISDKSDSQRTGESRVEYTIKSKHNLPELYLYFSI